MHPSSTSVPITVLLYNGPLLCGFNVFIKGLIECGVEWRLIAVGRWFIRGFGRIGWIVVKRRGCAGSEEDVAGDGGFWRERKARRWRLWWSSTRLLAGGRRRVDVFVVCVARFCVEMQRPTVTQIAVFIKLLIDDACSWRYCKYHCRCPLSAQLLIIKPPLATARAA